MRITSKSILPPFMPLHFISLPITLTEPLKQKLVKQRKSTFNLGSLQRLKDYSTSLIYPTKKLVMNWVLMSLLISVLFLRNVPNSLHPSSKNKRLNPKYRIFISLLPIFIFHSFLICPIFVV